MADHRGVELGFTPGGKRVVAYTVPNRSIHMITMEGGGKMPEVFEGAFAGLAQCKVAFEEWLASKDSKPASRATRKRKPTELSDKEAV